MIEIIEGTWAPGELKTFHINGEYFEILDAQYPCDVFLLDRAGAQASIMRKGEASFFSKPTGGFNSVQIHSDTAQYIRFFVGSGDAGTRRISSVVQVVDGGKLRSLSGAAFIGSSVIPTMAGNRAQVSIYNPSATARIIINSIFLGSNTSSELYLTQGQGVPDGVPLWVTPKLMGLPNLPRRYEAQQPVMNSTVIAGITVQANSSLALPMTEPFVIPPGAYMGVRTEFVGATLSAIFQGYEESTL